MSVDFIGPGRVCVPLGRSPRGGRGYDTFYIQPPDEQRFGTGHAPDMIEIGTSYDRFIVPVGVLREMLDAVEESFVVPTTKEAHRG